MSELLVHLQETYGTLMPHEFQEKEDEAKRMTYNPRDPIASVFPVVDDLVKLSVLAATPLSNAQQVNIGYIILHKTGKFSHSIIEWNRKPVVDKTWENSRHTFSQHTRSCVQPPI